MYDYVCHYDLVREVGLTEYPISDLVLSLSTYTWPRRLRLNGLVSRGIAPTRSVVAGNASATYEVKMLLLRAITGHQHVHVEVAINVHIDDLIQDAEAETTTGLARLVSNSAADLADIIKFEFGFCLVDDKLVAVVSDDKVLKVVALALGDLAGQTLVCGHNFGVDYTAGRTNVKINMRKVRLARLQMLHERQIRVRKLAKTKRRAAKVFSTGTSKGLAHGNQYYWGGPRNS